MQTVPDIAPGELPEVPENQLEDLDAIHADPRNPQDHGPESVEAVAASLAEFGQQKPVVIDADGVLIAGHGTVTAARALGWRRIWAVRSDLQGTDRSGYQVADNATAQHAAWNGKLAEVVEEIHQEAPEKASALGLKPEHLERLLSGAEEQEDGEAPSQSDASDGLVRFDFGDYAGLVDPETYAAFRHEAEGFRLHHPEATVGEILADMLQRTRKPRKAK